MIQHIPHQLVAFLAADVLTEQVQAHFIAAHQPDGAEVIAQGTDIFDKGRYQLGVDDVFLQPFALNFQTVSGDVHVFIQRLPELRLITVGFVGHARQIQRDHADGAGAVAGAEQTAVSAAELTQVKPEPAAHTPGIGRIHI